MKKGNKKLIIDSMSIQIIDATEQLILEQGIEKLNVSKILKHLNITNRVFYNRYNNIQEVLQKIFERVIARKKDIISIEYDGSQDYFEYVMKIATNFLLFAYEVQDKFNYLIFGSDVFTQNNYEWYLVKIKEIIQLGRSKNLLKDFDDEAMGYFIWCSLRGFNADVVMRMEKEEAVNKFQNTFKYLLEGIKK